MLSSLMADAQAVMETGGGVGLVLSTCDCHPIISAAEPAFKTEKNRASNQLGYRSLTFTHAAILDLYP